MLKTALKILVTVMALVGIGVAIGFLASNTVGALVCGALLCFGGLALTTFVRSDIEGAGVDVPNH